MPGPLFARSQQQRTHYSPGVSAADDDEHVTMSLGRLEQRLEAENVELMRLLAAEDNARHGAEVALGNEEAGDAGNRALRE